MFLLIKKKKKKKLYEYQPCHQWIFLLKDSITKEKIKTKALTHFI